MPNHTPNHAPTPRPGHPPARAEDPVGDDPTGAPGATDLGPVIRAFLVDTFLLGEDDGFAEDESLLDAGIIDSTGVMELVAFLEGRFQVTIADDELVADNLDSVDRLAAFARRKLAATGAGTAAGPAPGDLATR